MEQARRAMFALAGVMILSLSLAVAAEEEAPPAEGEGRPAAEGRAQGRRRNFDRQRQARGGDMRRGGRRGPMAEGLTLTNCIDAVSLALAQTHVAKDETDKAVEVLKKLIAESKDQTAVGYAHLGLASIYLGKEMKEEADAELKKVKGPAFAAALGMMLRDLEPEARTAKLEELLAAAEEPLAKALLIRRLAREYVRAENTEKLIDLAARAAKLLTAEEAAEALEIELLLAAAGADGGAEDRGQQMRQQVEQVRERMNARIKELEENGQKEEAAQLRERMERMEQFMQRMRRGGGRGERGPEQQNPGEGEKPKEGGEVF